MRGDVRDEDRVRDLVGQADVIVPLAAVVGAGACDRDPWLARSVNLEAIQLLNRIRGEEQLVVFPVTNSGYGTKSGEVHCTEDTPLEPISLYGQTKVQAEAEVLGKGRSITLCLATVFGMSPRMRLDLLVNHFVYAAVTDGYRVIFEKDFKRNYIHVRDVADCFVHCIENAQAMAGRPYNAGLDDANLSKEELALEVKKRVPDFYLHFSEIGSDPDKRNYIVSNHRLRVIERLGKQGIETRPLGGGNMSRQPFWSDRFPERTLLEEDVDFVCTGEGPYTLHDLLGALRSRGPDIGAVRGLCHRKGGKAVRTKPAPLVTNLDEEMPGVAWDLLPMDRYRAHNWHCFDGLARQPYAALYTTLGLLVLLAGAQLVAMGILGLYLGRIYNQVKARPLYIVESSHGFPDEDDAGTP